MFRLLAQCDPHPSSSGGWNACARVGVACVAAGVALLAASCGREEGEDEGLADEVIPPPPALDAGAFADVPSAEPAFLLDTNAQVAFLAYHDFSPEGRATDMIIPTELFRRQMESLARSDIAVICIGDFLAWRRGEANIPDPSVVITIDDGWRSVYTEAFPVLREFGFPFTLFLYTDYVESGSRSLDIAMIEEMMAAGATIGSHSQSHPYAADIRAAMDEGDEAFENFLQAEMVDSAVKLGEWFGRPPLTYAYPGGIYNEAMFPFGEKAGYEAMFTVNPAKVTWETPMEELHRYVIHGDDESTFVNATTFRGVPIERTPPDDPESGEPIVLFPADGAVISDRHPEIGADFSRVGALDPDSLLMRISGLGEVPVEYDPETERVSHALHSPLRVPETTVWLRYRLAESDDAPPPLAWKFSFDPVASVIESIPPDPEGAVRPPPIDQDPR